MRAWVAIVREIWGELPNRTRIDVFLAFFCTIVSKTALMTSPVIFALVVDRISSLEKPTLFLPLTAYTNPR